MKPVRIIFTDTHQTSLDGIVPVTFAAGDEIELTQEKAEKYIDRGVAQLVGTKEAAKSLDPVTENKSRKGK